MPERSLYLPSTPFNLFVSLLDICQHQPEEAQIIMIDQKRPLSYLAVLSEGTGLPLRQVSSLPSPHDSILKKPFQRRQHFKELKRRLEGFEPTEVVVGSDRRVEFQYIMHYLSKGGRKVKGVYLDDGLFSYLPKERSKLTKVIESLLKKTFYGWWWCEPDYIGSGCWIDEARLFFPERALDPLKKKNMVRIDGRCLSSITMKSVSERILTYFSVDLEKVEKADKVVLIPHPHNLQSVSELELLIKQEVEKSDFALVKYHPKFDGKDVLNLEGEQVYILPDSVAFEFFLPLLGGNVEVVGDLTTALLSTRWLKPEVSVRAFGCTGGWIDQKLLQLYRHFGVEIQV